MVNISLLYRKIYPLAHLRDFVDDFRDRLDLSKYAFAKMLDKSLPAYGSLTKAFNRITLRDLVVLREIAKTKLRMTDSDYLDVIEAEAKRVQGSGKRKSKKKPGKKN